MNWLRRILHVYNLERDLEQLKNENQVIGRHLREIKSGLNNLQTTMNAVVTPGIARLIAKADATYVTSEFDPKRKAESDKLAEETIRRLQAEAAARAPYNDPS